MTSAEVVISGAPERAEATRAKIAFSVIERGSVVVRSQLDPQLPLNDHLVWIWNQLSLERRFLKRLQQDGGKMVCKCRVPKGEVVILPNGAEMLHLLDMELKLETK